MSSLRRSIAIVGIAVPIAAQTAAAQQTFPQTLYWGSGLIDIPVAWVPPISGDFGLNYTGKFFEPGDPVSPRINYDERINSQLTFSISAFGRVQIGVAAYSANPEVGFFGRGVLLREEDFALSGGLSRWLIPGLAVGLRNVGKYEKIDRFAVGYRKFPEPPNFNHDADSIHENFDTAPTFYGVATKSFSLAEVRPNLPDVGLSFSLGWGNGLFSEDGGLGERYSQHSTGGLFYGVKADFIPGPNLRLALMAENNAWDWNLGASLDYRGILAGLYLTEVGASTQQDPNIPETFLYNYSKVAFTVGWQSNIFALLRGEFLQSREAALRREREQLLAEIARRQQRIAALELEINRYEAQNLLELEQRRAQAEAELRQEREALRRLEERLRRIEQQQTPPRR